MQGQRQVQQDYGEPSQEGNGTRRRWSKRGTRALYEDIQKALPIGTGAAYESTKFWEKSHNHILPARSGGDRSPALHLCVQDTPAL